MNLACLAEQNLVEHGGEYERLVFEGRGYTNRYLHERSCRLATALHALGLSPGDKVVVMMTNCPEVFWFRTPASGARGWSRSRFSSCSTRTRSASILKDSEGESPCPHVARDVRQGARRGARAYRVRIVVTGGGGRAPLRGSRVRRPRRGTRASGAARAAAGPRHRDDPLHERHDGTPEGRRANTT